MLIYEFFNSKSESEGTFDFRSYYTCRFCGLTLGPFQTCGSFPTGYDPHKRLEERLEEHIMKYHKDELKSLTGIK